MLLIVAHHYVVNSGLTDVMSLDPTSWRTVFLSVFGAFGKIGINCFVLITGYFMCTSSISLKKFVRLVLEVCFYNIVIYLIFIVTGHTEISVMGILKAVLPITEIGQNFTGCFLLFYLTIPFLNVLVRGMSEKQHIYLLVLVSFIYIFFGTVKVFDLDMNYISWFAVLYFISSYIRLYPKKLFESTRIWGVLSLISLSVCIVSIVLCIIAGTLIDQFNPFFFVFDSNTFLAVFTGISSFMFFKDLKIKNSRLINTVAASSFGVLLIHANSAAMRQWLWVDVLNNVGIFYSDWLVVHAIVSVLAIYVICTVLDILRIHLLEAPVLKLWNQISNKAVSAYKKTESSIFGKLNIKN